MILIMMIKTQYFSVDKRIWLVLLSRCNGDRVSPGSLGPFVTVTGLYVRGKGNVNQLVSR